MYVEFESDDRSFNSHYWPSELPFIPRTGEFITAWCDQCNETRPVESVTYDSYFSDGGTVWYPTIKLGEIVKERTY